MLFSSTGTISKFTRMGKLSGFGDPSIQIIYQGTCHKHDDNSALPDSFSFEVDESYIETWGEGISVFHNPKALNPLSRDVFPSVAHHYMKEDGTIVSYLPDFHPYGGLTIMLEVHDDQTEDKNREEV